MKKVIHHLRNKPEHIRRHILHFFTIVAGVILILLWIYSLGKSFSNPDVAVKINNDLKPFSALKSNLISGYESFSESDTNAQTDIQQ